MKKCMICALLAVLFFCACTDKDQVPLMEDSRPTEPTTLQQPTHSHSPTDHITEPTEPSVPEDPWYSKIDIPHDFDHWQIKVIEWNRTFYYIAEEGLYLWDPITEEEVLLIAEDIRGLYVFEERLYYFTEFEIFELVLGKVNISVPIWEHPERLTDPYSMGICGLMIHDDWFYIKDSGTTVIRYNPHCDKTEAFPEDFSHFVLVDNHCYYTDHANKTFTIYEFDPQTMESRIVRGDGVSKRYSDHNSNAMRYDELRSIHGKLYYYIRETGQFYQYDSSGEDIQFRDNTWILNSYVYPDLCYYTQDDSYIRVYEEDKLGNERLILSVPKEEIDTRSYLKYALVTESAVFYKASDDAPIQFAWKYNGKDG